MKAFIPYSREERRVVLSPGVDFRRPGTVDPFEREERQAEQQRRHELGMMDLAQMAAAQQHGLQNVLGGAPLGSHGAATGNALNNIFGSFGETAMANIIRYRPGSEDLERLTAGWVVANRINDVLADFKSKRHQKYLRLVQEQLVDPTLADPDDVWRHKDLVPRALDAFEKKNGCSVSQGLLYALPDYRIAAAPHAVESDLLGITVHCRRTLETYENALMVGLTPEMERHAQAMMWVTGLPYWAHIDYFEDPEARIRKLYERDVYALEPMQEQLGDALVNFYQKSVLRAARSA